MDIKKELQKLGDVEENFLRTKSSEKRSTEKLLLTFMRNVQISYGEIDMYVELLRSKKNTVNSLIAVKSCLQSFVDRKGEYDSLMTTISAILAAISAITAVWGFLKKIVADGSKLECLEYILIFLIIIYFFLILFLMVKKKLSIKKVTNAQLLINVIDRVLKEKEGASQGIDEKIAYISYVHSSKNRKFRVRRKMH